MESITSAENEYNRIQLISDRGNASISSLLLVLSQGTMLVMLLTGIVLVGQGELSGILLAVVTLVTLASFDGIQPLPLAAQQAYLSEQAANRILALTVPERLSDANPLLDTRRFPDNSFSQWKESEGLVLENVGFQYKPGEYPVFHQINLQIHSGSKIAIVGPSGAGKSTLARLILKFWNPTAGHIYLDGIDYQGWTEENIRNRIGYSGPNPYFMNATLRENLELIRSGLTTPEIEAVMEKVLLSDWYQRLPDGLASMLGDRGSKMSEGERKRLDLARLLILDRPVFLLDEPFANQDIQSQAQLVKMLLKESERKTLIIITHQLNLLEWADEIHVVHAGTIFESGNAQTLLQSDSLYRKMWFQQQQILPGDQA
jgi:ABC-type multidrug transport system fused ATPase/permease subunit